MHDWCVTDTDIEVAQHTAHDTPDTPAFARAFAELTAPEPPDAAELASCRAAIDAELTSKLQQVDALTASGELRAATDLAQKSVAGGALGFSSSLGEGHLDGDGAPIPSRMAGFEELVALAGAIRGHEGTTLEFIPTVGPIHPKDAIFGERTRSHGHARSIAAVACASVDANRRVTARQKQPSTERPQAHHPLHPVLPA